MSSGKSLSMPMGDRLVRAMAGMVDSPAGALWLSRADTGGFVLSATWNFPSLLPAIPTGSSMVAFLRGARRIIDMDEPAMAGGGHGAPDLPSWLVDRPETWLVVPLAHREEIVGFVVLDRSRAARRLDGEELDLLAAAAVQAAGCVVENMTAADLLSARRLEEFGRRFAFVVHDVKNVVGQMSMILENARTLDGDPDFRKDMLETIACSVARMRTMLDRLSSGGDRVSAPAPVDVSAVVGRVAGGWTGRDPRFSADVAFGPMLAVVIESSLVLVLDMLIDNGLSAAGPSGRVTLRLLADSGHAVVEVSDDGPGMEASFVAEELFRPLSTTKAAGYGIGAYQVRHLVHGMGGSLDVESAPQRGTLMRVTLPLECRSDPHAAASPQPSAGPEIPADVPPSAAVFSGAPIIPFRFSLLSVPAGRVEVLAAKPVDGAKPSETMKEGFRWPT